ncbi:serine hydrolase domain-containing protein [Streptomyces fulvorobeus]|uniref:CubicO group peptidase (Beta-lactamase class C family) n=1 Tax=Streptomyces fulvorobeus TaxID=284028 RepID=A0A7J0C702_9ACTN|nr:serine hydrolase domain-containing protein [Streptomyces fulvorobeus]NYE41859.1 CubicO group peptidase (beta-lactamase class C family) [Streptomyces fulvorobeus]GFM98229.1 serine hydrolase [Streptomyces fulvorobeus]
MTSPHGSLREELLPSTRRALLHRIATAQAEGRTPSFVAAVQREGRTVWDGARSCVKDHEPDADTQYRIGSLTKIFTAVLVLRLCDEGVLGLDDPLEQHLPGTGVGDATVFQLLSHSAGLAAESPAPWWERTSGTVRPELADVLGDQPRTQSAGRSHHYSNTGYTLLGSLVEAVRGASWEEVLRREILEPLGMRRTSTQPVAPHAGGWAVHPWADVMLPEPSEDLGLMAPAGQLWSTTADLLRFAAFLAEGDEKVLSGDSLHKMRVPAASLAPDDWDGAYGLGLQIVRRDGRTLVGHTGSLPGFLAALWICVEDGLAAVALTNATSGPLVAGVAADLVRIVAEAEPRIPAPWRPLPEADSALLALTGPWYWGTHAYVLRVVADHGVELHPMRGAGRGARFRFRPDGTWTGLDGYYAGETLRVVRNSDGAVDHLDLGSFVFTREPYDPGAAVPGGVDAEGWRGLAI